MILYSHITYWASQFSRTKWKFPHKLQLFWPISYLEPSSSGEEVENVYRQADRQTEVIRIAESSSELKMFFFIPLEIKDTIFNGN